MKERGARELPPLTEELCTDDFRGEGESAFFQGTSPGILQGMLSDPSVYRLYDVNYDQHTFYVCMKFPKISKNITFKGYSMNTEEVNHQSMSYIKKCPLSLLC